MNLVRYTDDSDICIINDLGWLDYNTVSSCKCGSDLFHSDQQWVIKRLWQQVNCKLSLIFNCVKLPLFVRQHLVVFELHN